VGKFEQQVHVRPRDVRAALAESARKQCDLYDKQVAQLEKQRREWGVIHAVYDVGPPPATHLLKRGDLAKPGEEVPARLLEVLGGGLPAVQPVGESSGRRLALAKMLTDWNSQAGGLTARVMVNRVWQHLMGRGIVDTTENLGRSGSPATHPELLEWLASPFVSEGTRVKPLIRSIVLSAAYQQCVSPLQSPVYAKASSVDPDNHLWWRMPLRRLEAEIVRDCLLATSGKLNSKMGGPSVYVDVQADGTPFIDFSKLASPDEACRRTIYLLARRSYHLPLLGVFDQPIMATNSPLRQPSTVVLQSLAMLNDSFVVEQAEAFAARLRAGASTASLTEQIESAFKLAYCRPATQEEIDMSTALVAHHQARYRGLGKSADEAARAALIQLCRMLVNSSEFIYIP